MPLSRTRDYLSIGEVLETIREEFPDISISKIRFLEAEGLISPERTASGYRKFYEDDLKRLRYILALQRDQFMPLKVIRERLDQVESNGGAFPAEAPTRPRVEVASPPPPVAALADVSLSRSELLGAATLTEEQLRGLEEYGILVSEEGRSYAGADLAIAKAARGFFEHGVEPRHLRMYKQIAEREAGFLEQIVTPTARRRDADAGRRASESLAELLALSRQMREALLRSSLDELL